MTCDKMCHLLADTSFSNTNESHYKAVSHRGVMLVVFQLAPRVNIKRTKCVKPFFMSVTELLICHEIYCFTSGYS